MSEVTKHVVAKLSTITKTVYRMQDDDLVVTTPSNEDARVTQVKLTAHGWEALGVAKQATSRFIENGFYGLSDDEIHNLTENLERVFRNLNGV